jgi:integrase
VQDGRCSGRPTSRTAPHLREPAPVDGRAALVMEIVGHSALEMTMNVYAHVDLDTRRDTLDRLADLFDE